MTRASPRADAVVLFVRPDGVPTDWEHTDLWRRASEIPGVRVVLDEGGREARRFGAVVSGETILYDAGGRLLFHGGITPSRGHEGDSTGKARVLALLEGGATDRADAPTYGCELDRVRTREEAR
jgi:hypothetical protein